MLDVKASSCWKTLNCFVAAAAISFGLSRAEDISPATTQRVSQLIGQLDDESYAVRQKATKELADIGPTALTPLIAALKEGSLERRLRAVDLIGRIYSLGEETSFEEAELALDDVKQLESGSLRAHARAVLQTNLDVRERLAIAAIRRLGGSVYLRPQREFRSAPNEREAPVPQVIDVMIDRDWTGGNEGLRHLRRIPRLEVIYRVKTAPISDEALAESIADLSHNVKIAERGEVCLGIAQINDRGAGGCVVSEVKPNSSAQKAGVRPNDVITQFDRSPVSNFEQLVKLIAEKMVGEVVPITVERDGQTIELDAELQGWPKEP